MKLTAVKVKQWLEGWNDIAFKKAEHRAKPEDHFYLFSIDARTLRALCGIYPRSTKGRERGVQDLGIQRRHNPERSFEISEFVKFGHPWSELSNAKRKSHEYDDLKKPGWLPTAIVVNLLKPGAERQGMKLTASDAVNVSEIGGKITIELPKGYSDVKWRSGSLPPVEVIDGQHRLWAFGDEELDGDFELPVVAFHGLDISWQAYLFYMINIKPKRINQSLAFDLYPLLRTEDWIERFEGAAIYRETRAQELVDLLYSHPASPWHHRINMLGETGSGEYVTQAAWVRSLLATFVKSSQGKRVTIGGLFGAPVGSDKLVLPWSRHEQAAFLIFFGQKFESAIKNSSEKWAESIRQFDTADKSLDAAFWSKSSLISQDQGIRGLMSVVNDLSFLSSDDLKLEAWGLKETGQKTDEEYISSALDSLKKSSIRSFFETLANELSSFDWRASSAKGLTNEQALIKAAFRGSGGYKDFRRQLLLHLARKGSPLRVRAKSAIEALGYPE